jgi:hypothetical protein
MQKQKPSQCDESAAAMWSIPESRPTKPEADGLKADLHHARYCKTRSLTTITKLFPARRGRCAAPDWANAVVHSGHEIAIVRMLSRGSMRFSQCFTANCMFYIALAALVFFSPSFAEHHDFGAKRILTTVHAQTYPQPLWIMPKSFCDPALAADSWNRKQVCVANAATATG